MSARRRGRALVAFVRRHRVVVLGLFVAAIVLPYVQDYREYVKQWTLVLAGENPWTYLGPSSSNTYGPVHNLLALPFWVHPRLPRVLGVASFVLACALLFTGPGRRAGFVDRRTLLRLTLYNPLLWISVAVIGHNDVFVALLLVAALMSYDRRPGAAGAWTAMAALLKIYPMVLVPFLALRRRRPVWGFVAGFASTSALIGAVSWRLWQDAFVVSLIYNADRPSKFLSVFRVLRGAYSPVREWYGGWGLDPWSVPSALAALLLLYVLFIARGFRSSSAAPLGLLVLLTLHKVGHVQFYTPLVLMGALVLLTMQDAPRVVLLPAFTVFTTWLVGVGVVDASLSLLEVRTPLREVVGVPTFLLEAWLVLAWIRALAVEAGGADLSPTTRAGSG